MQTRITELFGIEYPVIQGGMAWVATHELASAVSNAGGLGIIGAGGAPASWVREQIQAAKKETDKPFGVNLMLMNPEADAIAKQFANIDVSNSDAELVSSEFLYDTQEFVKPDGDFPTIEIYSDGNLIADNREK